ncbi:MAG: hypothetical protein WDO14_23870 [Bacteroidota bacterium]
MKNTLALICLCCIATACNFSKGTKNDLVTGLSVNYNGFSIKDAALADENDQRLKTNEVSLGQTVEITIEGIDNYYKQDGRVFPILDITVTDKAGAVVLQGKDIFGADLKEQNGFTPEYASTLSGTITVGNPMQSGETYHATMKITDKLHTENVIDAEVNLIVK